MWILLPKDRDGLAISPYSQSLCKAKLRLAVVAYCLLSNGQDDGPMLSSKVLRKSKNVFFPQNKSLFNTTFGSLSNILE